MNVDFQWLQTHIGSLVTEIALKVGEIGLLRQEIANRDLEIASWKDRLLEATKCHEEEIKRLSYPQDLLEAAE